MGISQSPLVLLLAIVWPSARRASGCGDTITCVKPAARMRSVGGLGAAVTSRMPPSPWFGWARRAFLLYSLLALGDLVRHVWHVERALRSHITWRAERSRSEWTRICGR